MGSIVKHCRDSERELLMPKTPIVKWKWSLYLGKTVPNELVLKCLVFSWQQIKLLKTVLYYYNPYNPIIYTPEYTSNISGHDFVTKAVPLKGIFCGLPITTHSSVSTINNRNKYNNEFTAINSISVINSTPNKFC
jgi:hypothetical protein